MPADPSDVLDSVIALTGDLRPSPDTPHAALEQARVAVAHAIVAGQTESVVRAARTGTPSDRVTVSADERLKLQSIVNSAMAARHAAVDYMVARRELPTAAVGGDMIAPDWTAGRAIDSSIGPFLDSMGRPIWIDLFRIVRQTGLVRSPGSAPFLTVPIRGPVASGDRFTLPAGSVWIAAQQLAAGAPLGGYTGLLIKGGRLTFSHSLTVSGDEIVVPPPVTCTLALELDPGTAPAGTGAGEDARIAANNVPKTVTFVFGNTGATIQAVDQASVIVYGSTVTLEVLKTPPTYSAAANRIFVHAKPGVTTFTIADVRSHQFEPASTTAIAEAAWALPVAVVSPASLGRASGAGGLALLLNEGLTLTWTGQPTAVPAGPTTVIVDTGLVTVIALTARSLGARQTIPLWGPHPGDPTASQIDLRWPPQFPLRFFSSSAGVELVLMVGTIRGTFDRPVTVGGQRVFVQSKNALIVFVESALLTGIIVEALLDPPPPPTRALAFALANAVFRTTPARSLLLVGAYDGVRSKNGAVAIGFGLQYVLPTLPDPYAANVSPPFERLLDVGTTGVVTAIVFWTPTTDPLLTYTLPPAALSTTGATPALFASARTAAATRSSSQGGAFILLDLSTNVDRFGVGWLAGRVPESDAAAASLAVDAMYLASQSQSVFVLTVPAVQWEPVFTETQLPPPSPPFPTPVTFTDSGGPTAIAVQSVQLVRVAPAPALDFLVGNFTTSGTPATALAKLTLPFGIDAVATLAKPSDSAARGATVDYNRPQFTAEAVTGGYQISVRAVDPAAPDSPSLQGWTLQRTDDLLVSGVPIANRSVLDTDVQTIFNSYLGPGSPTAQVPVTRLDLSGYGESLFSRWINPADDAVAVSQARFDVLIGRTSLEVVQVRSILYPYAVRVVRTITIQRKNSGVVVRRDSGWQASTDGEYLFPGAGLTTHPGVVTKVRNVTSIRDTGQIVDLAGGAKVAAVLFDADVAIEHAVKGAAADGVPARGQIGYVQLEPTGGTILTPAQYEQLIQIAGPLGGTLDCVLDVGGSGQLMKLGRVGVGVTQGMGGSEFVMTAWGSPQFPQGGQWSFLQQTGTGTAPGLVDKDLGVPLIRAGAAPVPPPLTSPYRFADPVDLATPDTPASDYGIVHATGTQRVFFPRPKIEATADRITSTRAPVLADPYSLANAVGFFPRTDAAVPFPDANYALVISGGHYKLQLPSPSFPVTVGQRTIAQTASVRSYADYTGSTAALAIDTSASVPWTFQLRDVNLANSSGSLGEVIRVTATIDAAANIATNLKTPKLTFGGALGVVQDIMAFLQQLGFPTPFSVSMTNKLEFKAGLKIPMDEELNKLLPPGGPEFDDTDVVVSLVIDSPLSEAEFELGATILVPTPFDPLKGVGMIKVEIKVSTESGNTLTLTVGAGFGVSFTIAGFGCKAYFLETMFLIAGDTVFGLGVGVLIKGSIDLEIISVDVSVEAKMAILKVNPGAGCASTTIWGAAQLTFAIEVTICWVIDIDFEVQSEADQNLNGGPCELPDVL
jgi:hypothetical protein